VSRRLLFSLALAGAIATGAAVALVLLTHTDQPGGPAENVAEVVVGGIWIGAGLVAWQRRPGNRVGPLMVAVGFVDVAGQLYWHAALPFTLAATVSPFVFPIAVHLFVAFPSGRITSRFERWFVGGAYAATFVLTLIWLLSWDPRVADCPECPANLVHVSGSSTIRRVIGPLAAITVTTVFVTLTVVLVLHFRRARGPTRRALAPVLLTAATGVVSLPAAGVAGALGADVAQSVSFWVSDAALAVLPVAFLVGLLRIRLQRSAVADLVVALGAMPGPTQARDAIARTLRDETLELAFWLPDRRCYIGPDGEELDPEQRPGRAVTVLEHDGQRVAALIHDRSLLDDPALVHAVGAAATLALENARLQTELRAQLAEVRASRARIVEAGDAERRRLERDLHDGAQQRLLGVRLALQLTRNRLRDSGEAVDDLLAEADTEVVGALDELRALARGIHPAILTEIGLGPALAALARRVPIPVDLAVCPERLPPPVEATAYFVVSEALANTVKHAGATHASVEVTQSNGHIAIDVADNGTGGADAEGAGLRGLRDRVETLDGLLRVESETGRGTRVSAVIPCV
jgi:signal transduction histidine kinase